MNKNSPTFGRHRPETDVWAATDFSLKVFFPVHGLRSECF
jgi:hypothetical protein